ncbi:MAG TPA: TolC family protein, partial [Rhodothermales bacterium]|nr:TolC family protein [Rhodothermales bacterium]
TAVESLLVSYTTGQADFLELLDAERTRYALSVAAEEARYRYLVALAMIERAMGDGPETTLPR